MSSVLFYKEKQNGEGGIRTLAPVNPTYTLSRGTSSANLSTSPNIKYLFLPVHQDKIYTTKCCSLCQAFFKINFLI